MSPRLLWKTSLFKKPTATSGPVWFKIWFTGCDQLHQLWLNSFGRGLETPDARLHEEESPCWRFVNMLLNTRLKVKPPAPATVGIKLYRCFSILCQQSFIFWEWELTAFLKGLTPGTSTLLSVLQGNIVWVERAVSIMQMKCIINTHLSCNPSPDLTAMRKIRSQARSSPLGYTYSTVVFSHGDEEMQMINWQGYRVFTQISWKQSIRCTTTVIPLGMWFPW